MWNPENRARYDLYPSDLTDEEWSLIGPLIPPAKRGGNKRTVVERETVAGLAGTGVKPFSAHHRAVARVLLQIAGRLRWGITLAG
jgi:transposase